MENKNYPAWIDEYAKAFHRGFANMVPANWGPIDTFAVFAALNGTFIAKISEAIAIIKQKNYPVEKVAAGFSCLSSLRCATFFLIYEYQHSDPKNKKQFKEVLDFLLETLNYMAKGDVFAYESNIGHSQDEIKDFLQKTPWIDGNPGVARELGKLYNSLAALAFSLYRDFFPQEAHEIYGPYSSASKFGEGAILLIKHFPKIKPIDIWPSFRDEKYKDVKIFQVYRNVDFRCEIIGMHSVYQGNLMEGLVAYAVSVDGEYRNDPAQIKELSNYFAELATKQSQVYEGLSKENLIEKTLVWECYQFVDFFRLADMDWQPTQEMRDALRRKNIPDRLEMESFPSFEEYATSREFEVYWLKDLYAN